MDRRVNSYRVLHGKLVNIFNRVLPYIKKWIYSSTLVPTKDKDSLYNRLVVITDELVDLYQRECNILPYTASAKKQMEKIKKNIR